MTTTTSLIIMVCLMQGALCNEWSVWMPSSIEALSSSCVLIPCEFSIPPEYESELVSPVRGMWRKGNRRYQVFDSSSSWNTINGHIAGDLLQKNCTTILEDFPSWGSDTYYIRIETGFRVNFISGVQITVTASAPKPSISPAVVDVKEGDSVTLNCSAPVPCPTSPPALTWSPEPSNSTTLLLHNQDGTMFVWSTVTLTVSQLQHKQKVTCTADYGGHGVNNVNLMLNVQYAPVNTSVSLSPPGSLLKGDSVTLSCSSDANPAVQNYTWFTVRESEIITVGSAQKLSFSAVEPSDRGYYYCQASNPHGLHNSTAVMLDVQYAPVNTSVSLSPPGSVLKGDSVTLSCSSDANPAVQNYTWFTVRESEIITIGSAQHLSFSAVEIKDSGHYFCQTGNQYGLHNSTALLLDVQSAPHNTSVSLNPSGSVLKGDSVTLSCSSDANPAVQNYTWLTVRESEIITVGSAQHLNFSAVEPSDRGYYYCQASNPHGLHNSTAVMLDVTYLPLVPSVQSCSRGAAQIITCYCEIQGNPPPNIQWHLSGQPLSNSTHTVIMEEILGKIRLRSNLTLYQSQETMPTLTCTATNTLGSTVLHHQVPEYSASDQTGFHGFSLLAGAAAGAFGMMLLCICLHVVLRIRKPRQLQARKVEGSDQIILTEPGHPQEEEDETLYANNGMLHQSEELPSLQYSSIDFSKLPSPGSGSSSEVIRGHRGTDYAEIRHMHPISPEENGALVEEEGEYAEIGKKADLDESEKVDAEEAQNGEKGQRSPVPVKAKLQETNEELNYGNMGHQQQPCDGLV